MGRAIYLLDVETGIKISARVGPCEDKVQLILSDGDGAAMCEYAPYEIDDLARYLSDAAASAQLREPSREVAASEYWSTRAEDGRVVVRLDGRAPDGAPSRAVRRWLPDEALRIAGALREAATGVRYQFQPNDDGGLDDVF
jgi:hypothetical protein